MRYQLALYVFALALVSASYVVAQNVKICEPKSVFMDDCNRCRCSDDGFDKSCTRIMCVKKPGSEAARTRRDYDGSLTCVPGEKFNMSCRECICTEDGTRATALCTLQLCPDELGLETERQSDDSKYCRPGSLFVSRCNVCLCPDSGLVEEATCTIGHC